MERNLFKIPIEEYEEDMETELSKGKKKEILYLFNHYNKLRSRKEFKEIEYQLHDACKEGDLDLITIYLSETVSNDSKSLQFKIDETNRTASLIKINKNIREIIIPRTFEYESVEYLITSISGTSKYVQALKFVEDSAVKTFFGNAFPHFSLIKEIYFPASLKELKEGWCCELLYLTKITISPLNDQFMMKDNKYLISKSDPNNNEFDTLLFACRDIEEISIPSNIKIISSYAFNNCEKLTKIVIPTNSNLQRIEKYTFSDLKINEIFIPSTVSIICEYAFCNCFDLTKVQIPTNSNLQTIGEFAFSESNIKEIYFPASLKELKEGWCNEILYLTKITISPLNDQFMMKDNKYLISKSDPNNKEFDTLLFANHDIEEISIPSNIKIISSYAFNNCKKLTRIIISSNSCLHTIGKSAFTNLKINEIFIPSSVSIIPVRAFSRCINLTKVEIPKNSNLKAIKSYVFFESNIKEIFIPSTVSIICEYAFSDCRNLTKVEIPTNSNLQTIGNFAFSESNLKEIFIPSTVSEIGDDAFYNCYFLQIIEILEESKLESSPLSAFRNCIGLIIMIPTSLEKLVHINEPI